MATLYSISLVEARFPLRHMAEPLHLNKIVGRTLSLLVCVILLCQYTTNAQTTSIRLTPSVSAEDVDSDDDDMPFEPMGAIVVGCILGVALLFLSTVAVIELVRHRRINDYRVE